jgi:hypothetical protein
MALNLLVFAAVDRQAGSEIMKRLGSVIGFFLSRMTIPAAVGCIKALNPSEVERWVRS